MAEFKLSRFRYIWVGEWQTGVRYDEDSVVLHQGKTYICKTGHTSSALFHTDLIADPTKWDLSVDGKSWKGSWVTSTYYDLDNIVLAGGTAYRCIIPHTSSQFQDNTANWAVYAESSNWNTIWSPNTRYIQNDLVKYGGIIYKCLTAHTSAATITDGLEFDSSHWTSYYEGIEYKTNWSIATRYKVNDLVKLDASIFICTEYHTSAASFDDTKWEMWLPGQMFDSSWAAMTNYNLGDVAIYGGNAYISKTDNNNNNNPVSSTTEWALFNQGYSIAGDWDTEVQYTIGSVVRQGGALYEAITNSIAIDPSTELTPTFWKFIVPGKYWTNRWAVNTDYVINDIVVWGNGTYLSVVTHTSSLADRPDYDIANDFWSLIISHNKNNAMTDYGDMETFNNDKYTAIHAGNPREILRTTQAVPVWSTYNASPSVFYVDVNNGIDTPLYGKSIEAPWKTIKYSCDFIRQGAYYPVATDGLEINKGWLITEMYQWMLHQMSSSIAPFSPTSLWDQFYAQRDAGYFIDALIYDMQRGGNSQTVAATKRLFYYGSSDILVNSLVEASIQYFVPSLTRLLSLMVSVLSNIDPLTSYQVTNGVAANELVSRVPTPDVEPAAIAELTSLMEIVTTALSLQTTKYVPADNTGLTAILYIKTGTYNESLPIIVPENLSVVGDELRSVAIQPVTSVELFCKSTNSTANTVVVTDTTGLQDNMQLQFISPYAFNLPTTFGGVDSGKNYYVVADSITSTSFQIQTSPTITFVGTTTNGSDVISNVSKISNLTVGATVTGPGIPDDTTVLEFSQSINSIATITISNIATASNILSTFTAIGELVNLTSGSGNMLIYAGDCLKDMFYMRNGTTMRNFTMFGLKGTLTVPDAWGLARPTGGSYTSLDPGTGPDDSSVWIIRRSPYMQNITNFGVGCTGTKIDGSLHNGGSKSMLHNDYTQVISDGIGVWCTGSGSITECVSVFSYYSYIGHFSEAGGRIRSTNGNSSYGVYGAVSEGYDLNETPIVGTVFNKSTQVQATVKSSFTSIAQLLKLEFGNAGAAYYTPTTNLLKYSNNFLLSWFTDGLVTFTKNNTAPTGYTEAWGIKGTSNTPGSSYVYQNVGINPAGNLYTGIGGDINIIGIGINSTFNVTVSTTLYQVAVNNPGNVYAVGDQIKINGISLGGITGVNDLIITVSTIATTLWPSGGIATSGTYYSYTSLSGITRYYLATSNGTFSTFGPTFASGSSTNGTVSLTYGGDGVVGSISTFTYAGSVPSNSDQNYTLSLYVYAGSSSSFTLEGVFSGASTRTSGIHYNVVSKTATPYAANGGSVPTNYGVQKTLIPKWYRIWVAITDPAGINENLQFRFYPTGKTAPVADAYSVVYGAQIEISNSTHAPNFYLDSTSQTYTAYANFQVVGAGTGAVFLGNEIRSNAVFQGRIVTDDNGVTGGKGYVTASNNLQYGDPYYAQLAESDSGTNNYVGMRLVVETGLGAGQYGYISSFNPVNKTVQILRESFDELTIISTTSGTNLLGLSVSDDLSQLYVNQLVQIMPTYYTTIVTQTSTSSMQMTDAIGGTVNTLTVTNTAGLHINMPISFSGTAFSTVTTSYTYYIVNIIDNYTIQISNDLGGDTWQLTSETGNLQLNYPNYYNYLTANSTANMLINESVTFTGASIGGIELGINYYISDIVDSHNFTISTAQVSDTATATTTTSVTVSDTTSFIPLNPIIFSGTSFETNVTTGTKYYISKILNETTFSIATSIITVTATITEFGSNLITVTSTDGFVQNQPIKFSGLTFGGIVAENVYFIQVVNDSSTFTISQVSGGSVKLLTSAQGVMMGKTCPAPAALAGGTGTMTVTSTGAKVSISNGIGLMNVTFTSSLFGGVATGTNYYVLSISSGNITLSTSEGGSPITLTTASGNMKLGAVGWDNITPGLVAVSTLDNTSKYTVEPRTIFSKPPFTQAGATSVVTLTGGAQWKDIGYGNDIFIAIPSSGNIGATSTDGLSWVSMILPLSANWSNITYGNKYWVAIINGSASMAYSISNGAGWRVSSLPSSRAWKYVTYGNGVFVAIVGSGTYAAYSTNYGKTWTASTLPAIVSTWIGLSYGSGVFAAVSQSGNVAWSYDGASWQSSLTSLNSNTLASVVITGSAGQFSCTATTIPLEVNQTVTISGTKAGTGAIAGYTDPATYYIIATDGSTSFTLSLTKGGTAIGTTAGTPTGLTYKFTSGAFSALTYGNNRFVAIQNQDSVYSSYSFDSIHWFPSATYVIGTDIAYGQGAFVTVSNMSTVSYTSNSGLYWNTKFIFNSGYTTIGFGFTDAHVGVFPTLGSGNIGSVIAAGTKTQGRVKMDSGVISTFVLWEPGSNYLEPPTLEIIDHNLAIAAVITPRIDSGSLANPTIINRGSGYNTSSTVITISGNGYSDAYQSGYRLIVNNLNNVPAVGSNLTIENDSQVYKVTNADVVYGSTAPFIEANIQVSPTITNVKSPENGVAVSIRQLYSQCRLTNHDFLSIGAGNRESTNYPYVDPNLTKIQNITVELNQGRVFFTSTDQDGNFNVGNLFGVQQSTGTITLSATQFGLEGLDALSLGGIAVGGSSVVITQFSTDPTFTASSDYVISTQRAIKSYLTSRLSQGGANTFTGQLTAGTVMVGGADRIRSSVPNGQLGSVINIANARINASGMDGNYAALQFFMNSGIHRGTVF